MVMVHRSLTGPSRCPRPQERNGTPTEFSGDTRAGFGKQAVSFTSLQRGAVDAVPWRRTNSWSSKLDQSVGVLSVYG